MMGEEVEGTTLVRLRLAGGDYRWVEVKSVLIDWEGKPATINFMTDVDDRIKAQNELRETENKYRLVVENTQDAIVVLQDEMIKFMNERTPFLLGMERDEMESKPFINLVYSEDRKIAMKRYRDCLRGKAIPPNQILRFIHKDGLTRYGEVTKICIDWEGNPGVLTFVSDVTDRVNAEKEAAMERSKSEFYLDLLGHDIGNLMQGISAWIEMARRHDDLDSRLKLYLDQSWQLSERSKRLVKNVLIISRIRDREPRLEVIDLASMAKRTIRETMNSFPDIDVELIIEEKDCEFKIMAEPIIEEVFYNIIHNAIKFQMGSKPKVKLACVQNNDGWVKIEITDWGPGIPDAQKRGIFERFKDITGRKSTGIGLALTKELMDRYGGSIAVGDNIESGEIVGAKFILGFPILK
jgi:PAS domain S-box-containing protein